MVVPAVLSTLNPDGSPITSAVWFGFLGDDIIVSTPAGRPKARNVRADGRVSFLVDTKERPYRGVALEAVAEVIEDPGGALVLEIARRYLGAETDSWLARRGSRSERVILRLRPRRVRPWNMAGG
jgi:PPOX class probable F420-dependent enzyme